MDEGISSGAAKEMGSNWANTFANVKAAVTRGWVEMIQGIDDKLASMGMPSLTEMIKRVGEIIENAMKRAAAAIGPLIEKAVEVYRYIVDNWAQIEPVVQNVVAALIAWKTAQIAVNMVMNSSPLFMFTSLIFMLLNVFEPLRLVILAVATAVGILNLVLRKNPVILVATAIAFVILKIIEWIRAVGGLKIAWLIVANALLTAWDWVKIGFVAGGYWVADAWNKMMLKIAEGCVAIINFMGDMKAGVLKILENMLNAAIGLINWFIGALNKIPGVNIQLVEQVTFGTQAQLENEATKQAWLDDLSAYRDKVNAGIAERAGKLEARKANARAATAERLAEIEAAKAAAQTEEDIADEAALPELADTPENIASVANNTANTANNTKKTADFSEENLKYLRDIAERDTINRFTTAEVNIDFGGVTNNVNSDMDLDGIVYYIAENTRLTLEDVAEGVHR